MKFTMRDKVCKLIGKYENEERLCRDKVAAEFISRATTRFGKIGVSEDAVMAFCYGAFLADLKSLLEEDEAPATPEDPRRTAPAGKWCADSAACAAESAAKEARSNG